MPISAIDDCSEEHWADVLAIHESAIEDAGFTPNLVSNADDVGIIQKRIIQNLYENPIVVCDVSGKNPNVMFELGIRLAFDKPTIIVKDEKTSYSFDTAPIEHLQYPRDLRYADIVNFKEQLAQKISATHEKATRDPNYTTFLKNFGTFTVPKLDTKEIDKEEFILGELKSLRQLLSSQMRPRISVPVARKQDTVCMRGTTKEMANAALNSLIGQFGIPSARLKPVAADHFHIDFPLEKPAQDQYQEIINLASQTVPNARWLRKDGAPPMLPKKADSSQ